MRSTTPHIRSSAAFRLVASVVLVAGVWLAAVSRWVVSDLVVRWDSKNQFYAFFRFLSAAVRAGQSEHRGPAIAGVQSGVRSLGASRSGTGDADVRSVRICSLISRRNQYRHNRLARDGQFRQTCWLRRCSSSEARRLAVSSIPALLSFTRCSRWRFCCCNSRFNGDHCSWPQALPS
jgi:hypothetical protein